MTTTEERREWFRDLATRARKQIREGTSDAANAATAEMERLVQPAVDAGVLLDFLGPLTEPSEHGWVRYNAASLLLSNGHTDEALPVLEDLRDNGRGLAASGAEAVLLMWRKQQQN